MWILKLPSLKAFRSFSSILMHLAPWNFNGLPLSDAALGQIYSMHLKRLKNLDTSFTEETNFFELKKLLVHLQGRVGGLVAGQNYLFKHISKVTTNIPRLVWQYYLLHTTMVPQHTLGSDALIQRAFFKHVTEDITGEIQIRIIEIWCIPNYLGSLALSRHYCLFTHISKDF